jgi:hypothetical protein
VNIFKLYKIAREPIQTSYGFENALPYVKEQICNGVGPASWSEELREAVGAVLGVGLDLSPATDPHDWGYSFAPNTKEAKEHLDKQLGDNLIRVVWRGTPWYNISLLMARLSLTRLCYLAVKECGDEAFQVAQALKLERIREYNFTMSSISI